LWGKKGVIRDREEKEEYATLLYVEVQKWVLEGKVGKDSGSRLHRCNMRKITSYTIDEVIEAHWAGCDVGLEETPEDYAIRHEEARHHADCLRLLWIHRWDLYLQD
jgi:hypothetical protein